MFNYCIYFFLHPGLHLFCEYSARNIVLNKINILEPSSRFIVAVSQTLFHCKFSSLSYQTDHISSLGSIKTRNTALKCSNIHPFPEHDFKDVLELDKATNKNAFLHFLIDSRKILHGLCQEYKVNFNDNYGFESLYLNLIVHAIDHCSVYDTCNQLKGVISFDGARNIRSFVRYFFWLNFWVPATNNIFDNENIRHMNKDTFYGKLYQRLVKVDEHYANYITTSSSW